MDEGRCIKCGNIVQKEGCPICQEQKEDKFYLCIHVETKEDTLEVPMADSDTFQVRTDGVYLEGKLTFWQDIICVLLVPKWEKNGG